MKHAPRGRRGGRAHRAGGPFGRRASPRPTERSRRSGRRSEGVPDGPRRILLVDDHPIVRQGLAELIKRQKNLRICGETGSGQEVPELVRRLKPDLAVIDVSLKDGSGLELLKVLKAEAPHLALLVLSMHEESLYAERSLRAGALGYIMKGEANERILKAIYSALKGEIYLSDRMKERLLHHLVESATGKKDFSLDRLSDRELEVFRLIGDGFGTRQIAERLRLSVKTIESYRESLKRKLQLRSGAELVQQAIQWARSESPPI